MPVSRRHSYPLSKTGTKRQRFSVCASWQRALGRRHPRLWPTGNGSPDGSRRDDSCIDSPIVAQAAATLRKHGYRRAGCFLAFAAVLFAAGGSWLSSEDETPAQVDSTVPFLRGLLRTVLREKGSERRSAGQTALAGPDGVINGGPGL